MSTSKEKVVSNSGLNSLDQICSFITEELLHRDTPFPWSFLCSHQSRQILFQEDNPSRKQALTYLRFQGTSVCWTAFRNRLVEVYFHHVVTISTVCSKGLHMETVLIIVTKTRSHLEEWSGWATLSRRKQNCCSTEWGSAAWNLISWQKQANITVNFLKHIFNKCTLIKSKRSPNIQILAEHHSDIVKPP